MKLGVGDLARSLGELTRALVTNILALPILASSGSFETIESKLDLVVYWIS